jgi:hypothetical protein
MQRCGQPRYVEERPLEGAQAFLTASTLSMIPQAPSQQPLLRTQQDKRETPAGLQRHREQREREKEREKASDTGIKH